MPDGFNFTRLSEQREATESVTIYFSGQAIEAQSGDTVIAALLAAGHFITRMTPVSGASRGPLCLMGVCFECLLEINGEPNRQGCMIEVQSGMQVRPMSGARSVSDTDE